MSNPTNVRKRRGANCLSDFLLDQWRLGTFEIAEDKARASTHLGNCAQCRARLGEIEAVVLPSLDFSGVSPASVPHLVASPTRWRWRTVWLAPVVAAAAAGVLLMPWHHSEERSKGGGWQLGVVAQSSSGKVSAVSQGAVLAPGDRLRFEVSAPTDGFVSVISLDARGAVTPFVPATGTATAIRAGKRRLLDGAVQLDDSVGPERLVLLACPHALPVAEAVAAGRAALARAQGHVENVEGLGLPCTQTSFWIQKEMRP